MTKTGQLWGRTPEMLEEGPLGYDERVDLWGAAVCLYFLIEGYAPFCGSSEQETIQNIITINYKPLGN